LIELALGILRRGRNAGVYRESSGHDCISPRLVYQWQGFWVVSRTTSFSVAVTSRIMTVRFAALSPQFVLILKSGSHSDRALILNIRVMSLDNSAVEVIWCSCS
jgi:hypothetical protein